MKNRGFNMHRNKPHVDFIELHILHHASVGPLYGLWMIEELAEHGYKLNASQLYPRFHRLQDQGFLNRSDSVVDGRLRKYYRITRPGRLYLAEQRHRLVELVGEALSAQELEQALKKRRSREKAKRRVAGPEP